MAKTLGIIDLTWRGVLLPVETKTAKLKLGGMKSSPVILNRRVDYAQDFEPSEIDATIVLEAGTSLLDLFDGTPGELQCVCDTGQTYIFPTAVISVRPEATAGEGGKVPIKWFDGDPLELVK